MTVFNKLLCYVLHFLFGNIKRREINTGNFTIQESQKLRHRATKLEHTHTKIKGKDKTIFREDAGVEMFPALVTLGVGSLGGVAG